MLLSACFILRDRLPVQTEQTCDSTHKLFPTPFVSGIAVFIVEAEFFRHTKPAFPMFCRLEAEVEPALYLTELQERRNDPSSTVHAHLNRVVRPLLAATLLGNEGTSDPISDFVDSFTTSMSADFRQIGDDLAIRVVCKERSYDLSSERTGLRSYRR